jgi:arginine/lysine/ornithine decarboxylase
MSSGIDTAVISTHKVLGSLTQAAVLNVQGSLVDVDRLGTTIDMVNTTSPSVLILASIDATRRQMALHGKALLDRTIELAQNARQRLQAIPGVGVLDSAQLGVRDFDQTKLVVDVDGLQMTGYDAEDVLRNRFGVGPEMSDEIGLVFLVTIADTQQSIDRLVDAFATISRERYTGTPRRAVNRSSGSVVAPGKLVMSPRDAFFAVTREVPLAAAGGEISADLVLPYPPGIPVLAPGEVITADKIAYLLEGVAHGQYISGPADPTLATIRVVV